MSRRRRAADETAERLRAAEAAASSIAAQGVRVGEQISFVAKLTEGWRRVHEYNHLAQLFHEER